MSDIKTETNEDIVFDFVSTTTVNATRGSSSSSSIANEEIGNANANEAQQQQQNENDLALNNQLLQIQVQLLESKVENQELRVLKIDNLAPQLISLVKKCEQEITGLKDQNKAILGKLKEAEENAKMEKKEFAHNWALLVAKMAKSQTEFVEWKAIMQKQKGAGVKCEQEIAGLKEENKAIMKRQKEAEKMAKMEKNEISNLASLLEKCQASETKCQQDMVLWKEGVTAIMKKQREAEEKANLAKNENDRKMASFMEKHQSFAVKCQQQIADLKEENQALLAKQKDAEELRKMEAKEGHSVEQVLNWSKDEYGHIKYYVKWRGYSSKWNSWETREKVAHSDVIKEYEAANKLDQFLGISKSTALTKGSVGRPRKKDCVQCSTEIIAGSSKAKKRHLNLN